MRARGFALSELLVAVAIAGLIISVLTFLNVDYVAMGRRVGDIQTPYEMGRRAQALDPCANPGAVLTAGENQVTADVLKQSTPVLTLTADGARTQLSTPAGLAGTATRPVRVIVESTTAPGGSMAAIEVGDATVGVVAQRCDLKQVCSYDATNVMCAEDEVNATDSANAIGDVNATDGGNTTVAGNAIAAPG
jgi:prepilin-type N-terminal cleavage/methylation domain-containing protein